MSKAKIGIIYPPEKQKVIIDKTAKFVAINGEEFEYKIIQKGGSNAKFNFLKPENPFHGYYKFSIKHFLSQLSKKETLVPPLAPTPMSIIKNREIQEKIKKKKRKKQQMKRNIPTSDPLPILYNLEIPTRMTPLELETIKLTALFVARNGLDFLGVIAGRESFNRRFDFLKLGHKYFNFYSKLVEVYQLVLNPSMETIEKIRFFAGLENKVKILDIIYSKKEWVDFEEEKRRKEEKKKREEEESQYLIDWHDFEVVETIDFDDNMMDILEIKNSGDDDENDEMEIDDEGIIDNSFNVQDNNSQDNMIIDNNNDDDSDEEIMKEKGIKIVDDYEREKKVRVKKVDYMRDPITGALVPTKNAQNHVRIQLIDPAFKVQKEKEMAKFKNRNIADDIQITEQLSELKKRRTDIFGKGEVDIGKKMGEKEEVDSKNHPKYLWDGRKKTLNLIPKNNFSLPPPPKGSEKSSFIPPPPPGLQNQNLPQNVQESIEQKAKEAAMTVFGHQRNASAKRKIQEIQNNGIPQPIQLGSNFMNPNSIQQIPQIGEKPTKEPPKKKKKKGLIPAKTWEKKYPGEVKLKIIVPKKENEKGWKLNGQTLEFSVEMKDKVYAIAKEIEKQLNTPKSKFKLMSFGLGFLKESKTCGFYNFTKNHTLQVVLKKK